ncbi:hypothetical protein CUB96_03805 [Akkermansia muciniphila]|nr:hypothetical protein CUB96_03805 [Akkermansia muciniphila]
MFPQQTAKAEKRSVRFRFRKQSARRAPGPFKKNSARFVPDGVRRKAPAPETVISWRKKSLH